jgi:hypothetical protein
MPKIRKKYITENIDESYYNIRNNIDNDYTHSSISTLKKSGILSSNKGKILKKQNSEMGTLPSTIITSGKQLQSFNDPFDDTNILIYSDDSNPVTINSNVGLPLVVLKDADNNAKGFYITTDTSLISAGEILESSSYYKSKFSLENSNIFDTPNEFNNDFQNQTGHIALNSSHVLYNRATGKIKSEVDELVLKQNRFQEEYSPFTENYSNLEIPNSPDDFYYSTVDSDIKENYKLGKQKQIKIVLDFSDSTKSDLLLLNTKLTFNLPNASTDKTNFTDNLNTTRYFNFLNGENIADSYSSHFLPTAYWNFSNTRWNYLDGTKTSASDFNDLTLSDFPVDSVNDIQYAYLGAKNTIGNSLTISPNFIFDSAGVIDSASIQSKHLDSSFRSIYNKPVLTTPSFRNDESLNEAKVGNNYNKSSISKITNSYGFPYKANWQPHNDHLLDMSEYIKNNFLIEKVLIKGKFSSRGEMPIKKGNFSSGYREASSAVDSLVNFNSSYEMKDNHNSDYIANGLTFFVLNERKGLNYFDQKIIPDSLQTYFFTKQLSSINGDSRNTKGKKLKDYLGSFSTYESYQDTLKVYSQIVPTSYLYSLDNYNNLSLNNVYNFQSNNNTVATEIYKNIFHYLENDTTNVTGEIVDSIYYKDLIAVPDPTPPGWTPGWNSDSYDLNLTSDSNNELYKIKVESTSSFNGDSGRELVSYSNFLICNKYSDVLLDQDVLNNIDETYIIDTDRASGDDLNLNIKNPIDFEVKSFVKSIENSDYTDESIYKIKSNYYETIVVRKEEESLVNISIHEDMFKAATDGSYIISNLFKFDDPTAANGEKINKLFDYSIDDLMSAGSLADNRFIPFIYADPSLGNNPLFSYILLSTNIESKDVSYFITFSYKNPNIKNSDPVEAYNNRNESTHNGPNNSVYWDDFVTHSTVDYDGGKKANFIDLNLRFLDPWDGFGIIDSWLKHDKFNSTSTSTNFYFGYDNSTAIELSNKTSSKWELTGDENKAHDMSMSLVKFIMYGIYSKTDIVTQDDTTISKPLYSYLIGGNGGPKEISISNSYPFSASLVFKESIFDKFFTFNDSNNYIDINLHPSQIPGSIPIVLNSKNILGYRGLPEVTANEMFYNFNNVLEGKNLGSTNNIDIISERVINREIKSNKKLLNQITSKSGKILQNSIAFDNSSNISYLIKPEDRLVFGVTSNCNGETMPTTIGLHDKLEITLIGRDYIENKNHKTNESKSIRKIVAGDSYIEKSGDNIYQTKDTYYDNVWDKISLLNSLEDFKNNKKIIGKNSSRKFGTYTGVITFDKKFNYSNNIIYKTDTINPSIATVFFDCLSKNPLYTIDSKDRFEYNNNNSLSLPSYKILLSDSISSSKLQSYPTRYENIITGWHKTFHLKENELFFNNLNNKKIVEYSYSRFKSYKTIENTNYFIYFDIDSYSAGLNYENTMSQEKKSISNNDVTVSSNNKIHKYYKTLKTYMLPYSKQNIYQNALDIKNNSIVEDDNTTLSVDNFIHNNKEIEIDITNSNWFINQNWSIQYLKHNLNPEYCDFTDDVKNDILGTGQDDGYTNGWCLVLEVSDSLYSSILADLDSDSYSTFKESVIKKHDSNDISTAIYYYKKHLQISIAEYPSSDDIPTDIVLKNTVVKNFSLIVREPVTGAKTNFLVSPLYFWETNEISAKESGGNLTNDDIVLYGRKTDLYNIGNKGSLYDHAWYAKLNNDTSVSQVIGIYDEFIDGSHILETPPPLSVTALRDITGENSVTTGEVPFDLETIEAWSSSDSKKVVNENKILISLARHKITNSTSLTNSPAYTAQSANIEKLNNKYLVNKNKTYFSSNLFFDNNITLIDKKKNNMLTINDDNDKSIYLNEKIYYSNCKKVTGDILEDTTINFIYKINNSYVNTSSNSQNPYKIIELKGMDNTFTLFKKNCILEDTLAYSFNSSSIVRVNEELLKENAMFYSLNNDIRTPYFEINLKCDLSEDDNINNGGDIKQIPCSHYKLDTGVNSITDVAIPGADSSEHNYNTGSPIYKLAENPYGYDSIEYQEDQSRDFFYGFSRGKNRYPIERLDGFKYGVESGSKKSFVYHYNNKSYGNFSDKVMGSLNFATVSLNSSGENKFTWTTSKLFVDQYFQYVSSSNVQNTYNKDEYSRSSYPYIENSKHSLSQLNSSHSLYNENDVVGRF